MMKKRRKKARVIRSGQPGENNPDHEMPRVPLKYSCWHLRECIGGFVCTPNSGEIGKRPSCGRQLFV